MAAEIRRSLRFCNLVSSKLFWDIKGREKSHINQSIQITMGDLKLHHMKSWKDGWLKRRTLKLSLDSTARGSSYFMVGCPKMHKSWKCHAPEEKSNARTKLNYVLALQGRKSRFWCIPPKIEVFASYLASGASYYQLLCILGQL